MVEKMQPGNEPEENLSSLTHSSLRAASTRNAKENQYTFRTSTLLQQYRSNSSNFSSRSGNSSIASHRSDGTKTSASDLQAAMDPLTPRSRKALEDVQASNLDTTSFLESRNYLERKSVKTDTAEQKPSFLDSLNATTTPETINPSLQRSNSAFSSSGAESSFVSRSMSMSMSKYSSNFSASTTSSMMSSDKKQDESNLKSTCGSALTYGTLVRIRLNNRQCLKISADDSDDKIKENKNINNQKRPRHFIIDVSGNGLEGDEDQIFTLVNANMRTKESEIRFADVVSLYCISGSAKGRFLSMDFSTQSLVTKKGPVISNAEKWRLINPAAASGDTSMDSRTSSFLHELASHNRNNESFFASGASGFSFEQSKIINTSDKVLFKAYNSDLFLSVSPSIVDQTSSIVVLSKENDGLTEEMLQQWEITKSNIPYDPAWNREREFLTGEAFLKPRNLREKNKEENINLPPLSGYPPSIQEAIMIDDLLYTFLGIEGRYIKLESVIENDTQDNCITIHREKQTKQKSCTYRFVLNQYGMDPSILSLTQKCFCLGEYYLQLYTFIEHRSRYEFGQISHAFCAALKKFLKEFTIVVAQIESQIKSSLTLQKLWFYIQPSLRSFEMLNCLIDSCEKNQKNFFGGGALLNEIQKMQLSFAGDTKAYDIFGFLLEKASVPYLKMIERWIYYGDIIDPYNEFMIQKDDTLLKEELNDDPHSKYWQKRFTIRQHQVPIFMNRFTEKILATGKYLNVFRTCNEQLNCPFVQEIVFQGQQKKQKQKKDHYYEELIEQAYHFASQKLLDFFLKKHDLFNRLQSIKHYFLMDQGDFFVDFMEIASEELKLRADKISLSRLESLLHLALQTSTCASDPYKEDLFCLLSPQNLISQMEAIHERAQKQVKDSLTRISISSSMDHPGYKAIDAFTLDYKVQWPLSLIISSGALLKYQMIFRHLFFCKHVEKRLGDAWLNHQNTKELFLRSALGISFCLRQRMLHFQQNFVYYMMFEVISPRYHAFLKKLKNVSTIDDILENHRDFLDICLKECLLTDPELLRVLTKLMTVCITFSNSIEAFTRPYFIDEETIKAEREAERERRAEKKAREEVEAMVIAAAKFSGGGGIGGMSTTQMKNKKKTHFLKRRPSSVIDMRRARIKELSDDVKRALTEREENGENPFVRMTRDLENQFDSLLGEFMQQLLHRSLLQYNTHLSNLCTRLDYNGFYTSQTQ